MLDILVIYHSQEHGHTVALAKLVAEGITESGDATVTFINLNEAQRVDIRRLAACDGLALGSPDYMSYVAGTVKQLFDDLYIARTQQGIDIADKPCVLFMTHGGGGRGLQAFRQLARRLNVIAEPFACVRRPPKRCPEAMELGRKLREAVLAAQAAKSESSA